MEKTLIILKPDTLQRGLAGRIITRFEEKGFQVAAMKTMREPTEGMLQAAHDGPLMADEHHMDEKTEKWLGEMWQAMIDAALDEKEPPA